MANAYFASLYEPDEFQLFAKQLENLPKRFKVANKRAIAQTAKRVKVIVSRRIREELALKKAYVDRKLDVRKKSDNEYTVEAESRGLLINRFPTSPVPAVGVRAKGGYRIRISRGGPTVRFRHLFPVRLRAGRELGTNVGLGYRTGKFVTRGNRRKEKIEVLHGPSVSQAFDTLKEEISKEVPGVWEIFLARELSKL